MNQAERRAAAPQCWLRRGTAAIALGHLVLATPSSAIVGPASDGSAEAAHVVMVLSRSGHTAGFCTGVIVAKDAVLTAAHCVAGINDTRIHFRDESGEPVLLPIKAVAVHPGFRPAAIALRQRSIDLALVRLSESLPPRFAPAALAAGGPIAIGQHFRIAGFGSAREGKPDGAGMLRTATLAARAPLSAVLLWADDPAGKGAGACAGDSGAPLFDDSGGVVAVTSWAAGTASQRCGGLTQAVLLAPQRPWLDGVLAGWNAH